MFLPLYALKVIRSARTHRIHAGRSSPRRRGRSGREGSARSGARAEPLHPQRPIQLHPPGRARARPQVWLRARVRRMRKTRRDWVRDVYHKPSDDLNQPVDAAAAAQFNHVIAGLLQRVANDTARPGSWLQGQFLQAIRGIRRYKWRRGSAGYERFAACGLIAGLLLSPKLWVSTRFYPLTPVALFPQAAAVSVRLRGLHCAAGAVGGDRRDAAILFAALVDSGFGTLAGRALRAGSIAIAAVVLSIRVHADRAGGCGRRPTHRSTRAALLWPRSISGAARRSSTHTLPRAHSHGWRIRWRRTFRRS